MLVQDPHPDIPFLDALAALNARFPNGKIDYQPSTGEIFVSMPLKNGGEFRAALAWQEAKYVAYADLTGDDLKAGAFPEDWPR
jgi:hypothetical protein